MSVNQRLAELSTCQLTDLFFAKVQKNQKLKYKNYVFVKINFYKKGKEICLFGSLFLLPLRKLIKLLSNNESI